MKHRGRKTVGGLVLDHSSGGFAGHRKGKGGVR